MQRYEAILPEGKRDLNDISLKEFERLTWRISSSAGLHEPAILRIRANIDHKLDKIIEACKDDSRDIYKAIASALYDVPYEEVTFEQRVKAKVWLLDTLYSRSDKSIEELLSEDN